MWALTLLHCSMYDGMDGETSQQEAEGSQQQSGSGTWSIQFASSRLHPHLLYVYQI